jgi:hypothetical protein
LVPVPSSCANGHDARIVGSGFKPALTERVVEQAGFKPTPTERVGEQAGFRPGPALSETVRALKTFSARRINELRGTPGVPVWQRNYYDWYGTPRTCCTHLRSWQQASLFCCP